MSEREVVCIVGSAPTTRMNAPFLDPQVRIWSLNDAWQFIPPEALATGHSRMLWFELHDRDWFTGPNRPDQHLAWLRSAKFPIFMWEQHPDIPQSVVYPEDEIVRDLKCRRYFTSSFSYMVALAAHSLEPGDEVHVFGIDLSETAEYAIQRPCAEYWFGRLEAKGIKVVTPKACPLLRGPRYGKPDPEEGRRLIQMRTIEERLRQLGGDKARLGAQFNENQGRIMEAQYLRALLADR